jgi:hypothetical protein
MNSAKRNIEIPKRPTPVALPLRLGFSDGSNAHIVTDANGEAIGSTFAIVPNMTVEDVRKFEPTARRVREIEYMLNAINAYEALVGALLAIYLSPPNKRIAEIVKTGLLAAGEIKE